MKQTILYNHPSFSGSNSGSDEHCLTGLFAKWAFFGIAMWWLWSWGFASHAVTWLIGIAVAFALLRRELGA